MKIFVRHAGNNGRGSGQSKQAALWMIWRLVINEHVLRTRMNHFRSDAPPLSSKGWRLIVFKIGPLNVKPQLVVVASWYSVGSRGRHLCLIQKGIPLNVAGSRCMNVSKKQIAQFTTGACDTRICNLWSLVTINCKHRTLNAVLA
jgi:hypothetical protein